MHTSSSRPPRSGAAIGALALSIGLFATAAHAVRRPACYPGPSLRAEYASSGLVFEGEVSSARPARRDPSREATLRVLRSWKGSPGADVTVLFALPACCQSTMTLAWGQQFAAALRPGTRVLVLASVSGRYVTARLSCTNTQLSGPLPSRVVRALDALRAR